ncbi:hypothetical protein BJY52DRAFT_651384 [Lactarius psammicola]|nr:hypothetical protein BJY52DRAFT_651384 [Lactarius psammicola]
MVSRSCYWAQPAQLHPWFKPSTLKRKSPSMLLHSESPSPVDEDDPDSRVKRQRRTTLTPEHTSPKKRKLPPSCPQSPTEEEDVVTKRQRCTALEHGIERLSLTPPSRPDTAMPASGAPELATRLPAPLPAPGVPNFGFSQWLDIPAASSASLPAAITVSPGFQQISAPTNLDPPLAFATTTAPVLSAASAPAVPASTCFVTSGSGADVIEDVKMRSSSWYEPEKDRIVVTDLDASSDDDGEDADDVDDAPKLPRTVLQALLRGGPAPTAPADVPRMLLAGLLSSPLAPLLPSLPPSLPPLERANFFHGLGSSDEAMDVEQ